MKASQLALLAGFLPLAALAGLPSPPQAPFSDRPYPQLDRRIYGSAEGIAGPVTQLAIASDGAVYALSEKKLLRLAGDRFAAESGAPDPSCIAAGNRVALGAADGVWQLDGAWKKDAGSPEGVVALAFEPGGALWAAARDGVFRRDGGWKRIIDADRDTGAPRALLPSGPDSCLMAADGGLFRLAGKRKYWLSHEVGPGRLLSADVRAIALLGARHLAVATDRGLSLSNGLGGWRALTGADGLPVEDLTAAAYAPDGALWLGSAGGLIRFRNGQWSYFGANRWLPDNRVHAVAAAPDGAVWAATDRGVSRIFERSMTLAEKARQLQQDLESRNRRHGYVTIMQLRSPGSLEGATQEVSDNDGAWTALYIASQSFRYAVTKDPKAREQAARSMQALLRLESITGIPGFPARAIIHPSEPQFTAREYRNHPEWHPSPVENGWLWKGDTSSDEIDGHYFAWYLFHELAATPGEKKQVSAVCKRVTDHILNNGYYLVDVDGKPTTWGVWAPEKLNGDPVWWEERGLNSLEILSHLKVAAHIVGDPRYEKAYQELIDRHHYAVNTIDAYVPGGVSHDVELAYLAYYPLLRLETDPALRAVYLIGFRRLWEGVRREASPVWNFMYGACAGEPCDVEAAVRSLQQIPLSLIVWKTTNSHRADLRYDPAALRRGEKRLLQPLPWTERPLHKWDKSPGLDGGSDLIEEDQTMWLLPYWLGRFHQLIE